jgi:hypothetical protein
MYKFFDYCFYRICYIYYKRKIDSHPYVFACGWVSLGQISNIMTIINLYFIINHTKYNFSLVFIPILLIVYTSNFFIFFTDKKYKYYLEYCKYEKHRKIKGWGVLLYVFLSFILWQMSAIKIFWIPAMSFS